jgi:hypothetical protein
MKVKDIKEFVERQPFRPFTVRLSNGAKYAFTEPRELGAPRSLRMIFYFGRDGGAIRIDTESIVEVFEN